MTTPADAPTTTVHLVRHGEVHNPQGVIYGRLPGFGLSERGRAQAQMSAQMLAGRDLAGLWASPLQRAQETAGFIGSAAGLEVTTDERLIETATSLQGVGRSFSAFIGSPQVWWSLRNPLRPTWGERYSSVRARMRAAIDDAMKQGEGREVVLVAHQTPIREALRSLVVRRRPTVSGMSTPCHLGSITTLVVAEGRVLSVAYFRPRV